MPLFPLPLGGRALPLPIAHCMPTSRRPRVPDALACLPTPSQAVAVAVYCRLRSRSIATEAGPERHLVKVLLEVVQKRHGGSSRHQRRSRSQSVAPTALVSMRRRLAGCMHRVLICLILPSISLAMGTTSRVARAAIAQLRSTRDKHSNLLNVAKCAGWAKRDGAKMLFLPECFGFMGDNADHTLSQADPPIEGFVGVKAPPTPTPFRRALAETIESVSRTGGCGIDDEGGSTYSEADAEPIISIVEELSFIAREADIWISGGGVHTVSETSSDTTTSGQPKIYNTHVVIDQHGQIKAYYHKIHLFDVSIPGKVSLQESKTTSPGNRLVVVDSPVGKLGLTICYDLRFGEMYVDLVQKMGAEVLLVPSAFTVPTGKAHWHALLRARAIESQCYVLAAAQVGRHNEKRQSYGHSIAFDPWGELVADAGGYDGSGSSGSMTPQNDLSPVQVPSIILSEIDPDKIESVRERMPIQQHRNNSSFSF